MDSETGAADAVVEGEDILPMAGGAGTADAGSLIVGATGVFNSVPCPQWGHANSTPSYSGGYSMCSPQDRHGHFFMPGLDTGID